MKTEYKKPTTTCHRCVADHLLDDSTPTVPFDPTEGTNENLAKKHTYDDFWKGLSTELHYELGQEEGNWYDYLDDL